MDNTNLQICYFCKSKAIIQKVPGKHFVNSVDCPVCGNYFVNSDIDQKLTDSDFDRNNIFYISIYLRMNNLFKEEYQLIANYPLPVQIWKVGMRFNLDNLIN